MNEGQPSPEPKVDIRELYLKPNVINEKIRQLKKEYYNPKISPGVEKKEEMMEEYELLKEKRADVREMIISHLEDLGDDSKRMLDNATGAMENAQKDFERGQKDDNYILIKQAKDRWQIANDFYQLLSQDEQTWQEIELTDEDDGFELGELKNHE